MKKTNDKSRKRRPSSSLSLRSCGCSLLLLELILQLVTVINIFAVLALSYPSPLSIEFLTQYIWRTPKEDLGHLLDPGFVLISGQERLALPGSASGGLSTWWLAQAPLTPL